MSENACDAVVQQDRPRHELLAEAKKRIFEDGDGTGLKSNANTHVIERVCGTASTPEMRRVEAASLPELPVLHLKDCSYAQFAVPRDAALVKVLVEGCSDVTLQLEGCAVRTETLELWKCERVAVHVVGTSGTEQAEGRSGAEGGAEGGAAGTRLATVQLDLSTGVELEFERAESVGQVVQAGVRALRVSFGDLPGVQMTEGYDELKQRFPDANDRTDQFVSRLEDGRVVTERLLRLANDFPTTEREQVAAAADKQRAREAAAAALARAEADGSLSEKEREALRAQARLAEAGAEADTMGVGPEARAEHRKGLGNEAFKAKEYTQAAVLYTEAIELDGSLHVVYANRAACFLQMREFDKALADCRTCQAMAPDYVKAHFREGMALMELAKVPGADKGCYAEAARAFSKTLDLDPNNAAAKSSLQIASAMAAKAAREGQ